MNNELIKEYIDDTISDVKRIGYTVKSYLLDTNSSTTCVGLNLAKESITTKEREVIHGELNKKERDVWKEERKRLFFYIR